MQALRESNTDKRCVFVKRIIDDLVANKATGKKVRKFHLSAITISELLHNNKSDENRIRRVIDRMGIGTMTIWPFDQDVADFMVENYHAVLGTKKLTAFSQELNINSSTNDMSIVREWMTKDLMIIGTAQSANCDVVLTLDRRTFLPLAEKVGYFCAVVDDENFNHSDNYVFEYDYGLFKQASSNGKSSESHEKIS